MAWVAVLQSSSRKLKMFTSASPKHCNKFRSTLYLWVVAKLSSISQQCTRSPPRCRKRPANVLPHIWIHKSDTTRGTRTYRRSAAGACKFCIHTDHFKHFVEQSCAVMDQSSDMSVDIHDPIQDALSNVLDRRRFMDDTSNTVTSWLAECRRLREQLSDGSFSFAMSVAQTMPRMRLVSVSEKKLGRWTSVGCLDEFLQLLR
jgi:hypothetical protein